MQAQGGMERAWGTWGECPPSLPRMALEVTAGRASDQLAGARAGEVRGFWRSIVEPESQALLGMGRNAIALAGPYAHHPGELITEEHKGHPSPIQTGNARVGQEAPQGPRSGGAEAVEAIPGARQAHPEFGALGGRLELNFHRRARHAATRRELDSFGADPTAVAELHGARQRKAHAAGAFPVGQGADFLEG